MTDADTSQPLTADHAPEFDLAIIGAGPVGLALAAWLAARSTTRALRVALIDARDAAALDGHAPDPRAIALSHGSRMLLQPLLDQAHQLNRPTWDTLSAPIRQIQISQRGHFGRTVIDHGEHDVPALGYVVRYSGLVAHLAAALQRRPPQWLTHTSASVLGQDASCVTLRLQRGELHGGLDTAAATLRARLVVNAEGGLFRPSADAGGPAAPRNRDYQQTAIVGVVRADTPRPGVAWERFTDEGPLAMLPLDHAGYEWAMVWCGRPEAAQARMALSDAAFLAALQHAFGSRLGQLTGIRDRTAFPLGLNALPEITDSRIAAIGNAAQMLHPVAGQGLNLGLRDAYALVDALSLHGATPEALKAFAARRGADRRMTIAATDTLARAFTVDLAPLPLLRGIALSALDWLPPVKHALARQMMFGQRR